MVMVPEMKRYTYRLFAAMTLYGMTLVGVNWWFRYSAPTGILAYVAAILPALPIAGVFVVIGRLMVELRDEYIQRQFARQSLVATGLTLSITTAWGFLEGFGLAPHAPGYYAATIWFAGLGVATCASALVEWRRVRAR